MSVKLWYEFNGFSNVILKLAKAYDKEVFTIIVLISQLFLDFETKPSVWSVSWLSDPFVWKNSLFQKFSRNKKSYLHRLNSSVISYVVRRQNLNSDFTDSALGSTDKSPLPYGNFQLRDTTVQSILSHPRYGPKYVETYLFVI